MGCAPMFCCFLNQQPNCMALTGLAASIVAFAFMIWGLADLWFKRDQGFYGICNMQHTLEMHIDDNVAVICSITDKRRIWYKYGLFIYPFCHNNLYNS